MNKTAIKNFATWARRKLISEITYKAGLIGISEKGILSPLQNSTNNIEFYDVGTGKPTEISDIEVKQRNALVAHIKDKESTSDYKTAFQFVVEEVAYTWFNRLVAIRFMEANEYLPSCVRVLSSEMSGKAEPDMVTTPFETDMEFSSYETDRIIQLKDENKLDELFRMLFIKQCNKLNEVLPELFEKTNDYTELLLTISFTDKDGIVSHLVNDIVEDDFKEAVEIIGWLYQYYNTEPKEQVFANLKKNIKITKENIPAATQLFTPDWIVRYMTENSLGRLWLEGHPNDDLKADWKYYLDEAEQEESVKIELEKIRAEYKRITPEDIKLIDPCMGSGHILVYAFDVFMKIYESQGYTQRDAAQSIIENNIYGLDIDERAYQLAYFALMMKARQYDRRFLTREIAPQVYYPKNYEEGQEFGSLLNVDTLEEKPEIPEELTVFNLDWEKDMDIWNFRRLVNQKYDVVITNPPYMGGSGMNTKLADYVKKNYPNSKADLFAVFIERCADLATINGFISMITMHSFMFLDSFIKLRYNFLRNNLISLIHLGIKAFDEIGNDVVQTASFIFRKYNITTYKSIFCRLVDCKDQKLKRDEFLNRKFLSTNKVSDFLRIPSVTMAYWVPKTFIENYESNLSLDNFIEMSSLNKTGDNEKYLRYWWEIPFNSIGNKWIFYSKGGNFRRYYGNVDIVINWSDSARWFYKNNKTSNLVSEKYWYREGITYSAVTSRGTGFRYLPEGCVYDMGGPAIFIRGKCIMTILALLNSSVATYYFNVMNPSINLQTKDIKNLPVIMDSSGEIEILAQKNMELAKLDWDSSETSSSFSSIPRSKHTLLEQFISRKLLCEESADLFLSNLETINSKFADLYRIPLDILPSLENRDIAIKVPKEKDWITSFVSYGVGCMFGRYSLDETGLIYAGGEWDSSKYSIFKPTDDNIIPITDEEYLKDDIVNLFVGFVEKSYGKNTLEQNLDFIANALGTKGDTSREIIRNYFIKDFYKDHVKIYQKRPIYWLYDSGKQNGFKALIYMHRYNADTTGSVRVDYLHKLQKIYMSEIDRMQDEIENGKTSSDMAKAEKRKEKLIKQLKETKEYDEKIAHLALSRIEIDLDDGVKVNYEKVQTAQDGKKLDILGKI